MELIKGGYSFSTTDERIVNQQRSITTQVNNNFIQVGATFLQVAAKNPFDSDWFNKKFRDTNLQSWIDNPEYRQLNLGFNLQFGWLDVDIDSEDPRYNQCVFKAMNFLGVDTRFAFGRMSRQVPSHIMVQLNDTDLANYDEMKAFEPKGFKIGDYRFKSELRSMGPAINTSNAIKQARQTVAPGSIYAHKTEPGKYDISVWYDKDSKVATSIGEIAVTTPRRTSFETLITGIAFGTFLYIIQPHWVEGGRQSLAIKVAGWLARLVRESHGINENDSVSRGTYCPIGKPETAEAMIEFVCAETGDPEANMRKRTFRDALRKLENNPDARIPGWPALEADIGTEPMYALRAVFMPGVDVSPLTKMADCYIFDDTNDRYVDRERFITMLSFNHTKDELERRHINDFIEIAGKMKPLFRVFETSPLRRRISGSNLYPDFPPGSIIRVTRGGDIVPDDEDAEPGTVTMFNTWRGWPIKPTKNYNPALGAKCREMMEQLFKYLCRDNPAQINWLMEWIAWTVQHPGQKQQVAPVFVGGQGVGKSFFGNTFLEQLFQDQHGLASPKILEGTFSVEPFINKMFVFIDEAKFHSESATDEIKKLIRNERIGGAEKFQSAKSYRIFSRVIFASNRFDMNLGQQNIQDRALFYIKTYDKDYLKLGEAQFKDWAVTIKPFFDEFNALLMRRDVKEHFMHIFSTIEVDRHTLENTALSSSNDKVIIESNMTYPRRVAKAIIEEGRIWEDLDLSAPFTQSQFNERVSNICDSMRIRFVQPREVMKELDDAGLIEPFTSDRRIMFRFKYKIGTVTEQFGLAIGVKMTPSFVFDADDFGENKSEFIGAKSWRGNANRMRGGI